MGSFNPLATQIAQQAGTFEPQRVHNWSLELIGPTAIVGASDIITLSLHEGFTPVHANEEVEVPYGNERVYVAGRAQYSSGTLVLKDWVDRSTASAMHAWRAMVHNPVTGQIGLARDYKATGSVVLVGPNSFLGTETFTRVWTLLGVWPVSVDYGRLLMHTSDQLMLDITLRYDKAIPSAGLITATGTALGVASPSSITGAIVASAQPGAFGSA